MIILKDIMITCIGIIKNDTELHKYTLLYITSHHKNTDI